MINLPDSKRLVLFDGVCNLCNNSVQFIIKHDKKDLFMFAALQSRAGQEIIKSFNIDSQTTDSVLLYSKKDGLSQKSTAALKIACHLDFPYNVLVIFFTIPTSIRDWVYDVIARNRYQWFGKSENCMVPTPNLQSKFLN